MDRISGFGPEGWEFESLRVHDENEFVTLRINAGVVELVDIPDLGSGAARHGGSSPSARTSCVSN